MSLRIDTDLAIIGDGEAIKNASIVIKEHKIVYAGETEHAPNAKKTLEAPIITPGFWDCHGHFFGMNKWDPEEWFLHSMHKILRSVNDVKETLYAGVTSVRELAGYGIFLKRAINEGSIPGPRIYPANYLISMTGGHGELPGLPRHAHDFIFERGNIFTNVADGVDECRKLVRSYIREGAETIKIAASGGIMSETGLQVPQYTLEEQKAVVEEAARSELSVSAHCYGREAIKTAIEAGVKTIEHGTYLDEDLMDLMIEREVILVPTVTPFKKFADDDFVKFHMNMLKMAIKRGVTIAMGTDIIFTGDHSPTYKCGQNLRELEYFVDAGMTPMQAIVCGTRNGPPTLGKRAPQSGILREGYDADIILLNKNPLDNIKSLYDRENIQNVIKQGITVS
ncbi:MAG: metal-dependent hydrolase family protein [Candidatus Kariarchaeaceae archaeon]|jgi:imidazolonepropionase-like amidohydrolase